MSHKKNIDTEQEKKRTQFCSCKNSCQKKTGPKRKGCSCKDDELYCSDKCECGMNIIECKNKVNKTPLVVVPDEEKTDPELVRGLKNLVVDKNDKSGKETSKPKQATSSYPKKGQPKEKKQTKT
ncbi:uncharacterized protein LOC114537602 isoform X2 [Dendronephthya gigantea]|uniref:uncharacterized protein LOC114537602 isoform X2 n=1 Tax=Dendronephthya gigantea TaxID=151771 RepID=UPI00106C93A8|nr:uncharacterized protein LOC114537602 isoform X2 [Dendronephthya gigantea]